MISAALGEDCCQPNHTLNRGKYRIGLRSGDGADCGDGESAGAGQRSEGGSVSLVASGAHSSASVETVCFDMGCC
jgi:hypothetical protein